MFRPTTSSHIWGMSTALLAHACDEYRSDLLVVPPARTEQKGRHPRWAFVQLEATYPLGT